MNQEMLNDQLIDTCRKGDLEEVKKLVNNGADIHYKKLFTYTPFEMASANDHLEIVKWLYEQGADPTTDKNFAIRVASERGCLEVVKYLYSIGCDPTADSNYAIFNASSCKHIKVVKFLALIGCDISKIYYPDMRKEIKEYLNKYKHVFNKCLSEIYGHPNLERTKTENEISFREYLSK